MKKTLKYMLAAFAVVTAASCAQELDDPNANPQKDVALVPMTINVGIETKVTVADDQKTLNWCDDDKIAIWDGVAMREFTVVEANGKTATFQGEVASGVTKFSAVYPYSAAVSCDSEGVITASVPQVQALDGGNVADNGVVAVCQFNKGENLAFKTATGYLRVDVSYNDVTEIIIDGAAIAGKAQFNADGTVKSVATSTGSVSMTPSGAKFAAGSYYVALLPGTTPAGEFSITLVRAEKGAVMTATSEVVIPRNDGFFATDTKLTESFLIKDAATFQAFLNDAKNYAHGQLATVIKDIDLTGVEITPAASFLGTLDGRNHSIKNWTSNETPLFTALSYDSTKKVGATVKNLKFDSSCKLTPKMGASAFGFLANTTNAFTVVENCVNNADITVDVTTTTADTYFGSLVGVSYGTVKNCVNNGDITVSVTGAAAQMRNGGIVGYVNVSTQMKEGGDYAYALVDCVNNGKISHTIGGKAGNMYFGGVASGTSPSAITEESASKGNIKNCVNNGAVEYILKNGGSLEDLQGSGGNNTVSNVAGVVGYWEGSMESCKNYANVKVQGPTLESNYAMSRAAVAGVAGFVLFSVKDCENRGSVYVKASMCSSGTATSTSGAGIDAGASFAGVVAQAGPVASAANFEFVRNHNYGELTFVDWMSSKNNSGAYFGGVAGKCNTKMSDCSNNASMSVDTKVGYTYVGGVVATASANGVDKLTNNGDVTVVGRRTTSTYTTASDGKVTVTGHLGNDVRIGGVLGAISGPVSNCTNNKSLTVTTTSVDDYIAQMKIGGVLGRGTSAAFTNNNNNGNVTVTHERGSKGLTLGGVVSWLDAKGAVTSGKNTGTITFNSEKNNNINYMGGFAGYISDNYKFSDLHNEGNLVVNSLGTGETRLGGVIGHIPASTDVTGLTNKGTVTVSRVGAKLYLGGIYGQGDVATKVSNCTNEGELTFIPSNAVSSISCLGGINGYCKAAAQLSNCINKGDLSVRPSNTTSSQMFLGGIYGYGTALTQVSNCTNEGDLSVKPTTTMGWQMYIGGIVAFNNTTGNFDFTSCINKGRLSVEGTSTNGSFNYMSGIGTSSAGGANMSFDGCQSLGDIYMKCSAKWRMGGLAAYTGSGATIKDNVVKADLTADSEAKTTLNLGGLVGETAAVTFTGNTYEGTLSATKGGTTDLNVGGLVGCSSASATVAISGCNVKADINGTHADRTAIFVGVASKGTSTVQPVYTLGTSSSACKVISGTKVNGTVVTQLTDDFLVGSALNRAVTKTNVSIVTE